MVKVALRRSDAICENFNIPEDAATEVELGPINFVQLTYDLLRVGPEGNFVGAFKDGVWWLDDDQYPFSDLVMYTDGEYE